MESPFFILLDLDPKPPLPEIEAAAAEPPELLEEDAAPSPPAPLWARILGYVLYYGIQLLWEIISTPG